MDAKDLRSERCGSTHSAWVYGVNAKYFVSYRTIVGVVHNGKAYRTARKYSSSTTRQLNKHFVCCVEVPEEEFTKILGEALKDDRLNQYHITMVAKTGW